MKIHSLHRLFFCIIICIATSNCTALRLSHSKNTRFQTEVNAAKGSFIRPYIRNINKNIPNDIHYKIFLAQNNGEHRQDTETAVITIPIHVQDTPIISFELNSDDSLLALKTPIKLFYIVDSKQNSILSLNLHHKIYWLEDDLNHKKVSLFLEQRPQDFIIQYSNQTITVMFANEHYQIPISNTSSTHHTVKIGLMRSDLLRYRGLVVPQQHLNINNLRIE
jgi:hypothetical protein